MAKLYLEIQKLKNQTNRMKLKLMIMEATLVNLEKIINRKRIRHGESLADKIAKVIMNLPEKKISQRNLLRRFSDKRVGDIIKIREILELKYNIKTFSNSHQKIIYYVSGLKANLE